MWREWLGGSRTKSICPRLRKSTHPVARHAALCGTHCWLLLCHEQHLSGYWEDNPHVIPDDLPLLLYIALLRVTAKGTPNNTNSLTNAALWENPAPCLSRSCVPEGGGVSERVEAGSPDWKVLKQWDLKIGRFILTLYLNFKEWFCQMEI